VIRNRHGDVMAALSTKIPKPSSMFILELLATRRAVQFVQEIGIHIYQSTFKGDSEIAINSLWCGELVIFFILFLLI